MGAGSLQRVDGETYLAVSVVGLDEAAAKSLTTTLLALAEERLPATFSIELAESLRVEFTAQAPTLPPEPTPTLVPPALAPELTPTLVR